MKTEVHLVNIGLEKGVSKICKLLLHYASNDRKELCYNNKEVIKFVLKDI